MQLMREKMSARVTREREHDLWTRLGEQFQPLVVDVSLELRRALQLPVVDVSKGGELYRAGDGDLLYYWIAEDRRSVEIGAIYGELPPQKAYDEFRQTIGEALGSSRWSRLSPVTERSQQIQEETEAFPQNTDLESARVLDDPVNRKLLQEAARRPGVTVESIVAGREGDWEAGVETLEQSGLVQREFQVFCRDTGIQLCKFASKAALVEAANMGFRSFSSGRPINEERLVQFLFITDRGRWLARRNLWLALTVADHLRTLGVQPSQLRWTYERDYKTVNLFTNYQQAICLFEVQEDAVTADEAYRFFKRAAYYKPDAAFLLCPAGLREDSRQVVARLTSTLHEIDTRVRVVQRLEDLEHHLSEIVSWVTRRGVDQLLGRFEGLTRVSVGQAVGEHLLGPEPVVVDKEDGALSDEGPSPIASGEGEAPAPVTTESLLDLDLDIDLSDLDLSPSPARVTSSSPALEDFDLDLDLDGFDFVAPTPSKVSAESEPKPESREELAPPVEESFEPAPASQAVTLSDEIEELLSASPAPSAAPVAAIASDDLEWLDEDTASLTSETPAPAPAEEDEFPSVDDLITELPDEPTPTPVAAEPEPEFSPSIEEEPTPEPLAQAEPEPTPAPLDSDIDSLLADDLDLDFNLDIDIDLPPVPGQAAPAAPEAVETFTEPAPQDPTPNDFPEEVVPEVRVPLTEKSPEEKLDAAVRRVLEEVSRKGLAAEAEEALNEFRDIPGCSAILSTSEGLAFQGRLQDGRLSDQLTALQPEIWDLCHRALADTELGHLGALIVEGGSGRMQVLPAGHYLWLSTYEQLATRHEEPAALMPGEMTLREAILKKVLEDLGQLDSIEGNLVISRDGLPIETQLADPGLADSLGVAVTQLLADSDGLLGQLSLTPIRQIVLKTHERMFSLIPLDQETVLITILHPDASRDIWQARLQGAATMLASVFQ